MPYTNGQKLKFVSTENDTVSVLVTYKNEFVDFPYVCSVCKNSEVIHYYLNIEGKTAPNDTLGILYMQGDLPIESLMIEMRSPLLNNTSKVYAAFRIDNQTKDFLCSINGLTCIDTMSINNHVYYNTIQYSYNNMVLLYSKSKGVLKFKFSNGQEYSLAE